MAGLHGRNDLKRNAPNTTGIYRTVRIGADHRRMGTQARSEAHGGHAWTVAILQRARPRFHDGSARYTTEGGTIDGD